MKKQFLMLLLSLIMVTGCTTIQQTQDTTKNTPLAANTKEATFAIEGMSCAACSLGVEAQWGEVDGVLDAKVNLADGMGVVKYNPDKTDATTIAKASTVYPAKIISE